jgi:hypothetical protein
VGKQEETNGKSRHRWEDNIKIYLGVLKDFFMDELQRNKTTIDIKVHNGKDLNSSQKSILHHNVQNLKHSGIKCHITISPQKCRYIMFY